MNYEKNHSLRFHFVYPKSGWAKITTEMIDQVVMAIEADAELVHKEMDVIELKRDSTVDGKKIEIWYKGNEIFKIKSEKELLSGKHSVTIYLKGNNPIKVIEEEENMDTISDKQNKQKTKKVFKTIVYEFNGKKKLRGVVVKGKRILSKASFPPHDYENLINDAKSSLKI